MAVRLPRARWWTDIRLVAAIALAGAGAVLAIRLWPVAPQGNAIALVAQRDLPAGMRIDASDAHTVRVDVPDAVRGTLVDALPRRALSRHVAAGSLITWADVRTSTETGTRLVTVTVDSGHLSSSLERGQQADVWAAPTDGLSSARSSYVGRVIIAGVHRDDSAIGAASVTVQVDANRTAALVSVLHNHDLDLVEVPR